ncbi:MAG TPA: flagellar filament capping protein FliD [Tepidiformaceae bacterium]|nr:flagellar filament capping protein FliD [Tepidiformaceae bacterium]
MSDPIRIGGFFSTFDTEAVIAQLTQVRMRAVNQLEIKSMQASARKSALASIQSAMGNFLSKLNALSGLNSVSGRTASVSGSAVSASTTPASTPGSFTVDVTRLASSTSLAGTPISAGIDAATSMRESNFGMVPTNGTFTIATATGGSQTFSIGGAAVQNAVTLDSANFDMAVTSGTFTIATETGGPATLTIDVATQSLDDVVTAINNAGVGITASITADANGRLNQLTLTSTQGNITLGSGTDSSNFLSATNLLAANGTTTKTSSAAFTKQMSLNDVIADINASAIGVTASITNDAYGRPGILTITSTQGNISFGNGADTSNFLNATGLLTSASGATRASTSSIARLSLSEKLDQTSLNGGAPAAGDHFIKVNGVQIDYNAANDSLTDIINRMNASAANVTAKYDSLTDTIKIQDKATGALSLTVEDDGAGGNLAARLGLIGAPVTMGQNAEYAIDGGPPQGSATNTIGYNGVSLTLSALTAGTPVTVTVSQDAAAATTAVKEFITEFNNVMKAIDTATKADGSKTNNTSGPLSGDASLRQLKSDLRSIVTGAGVNLPGQYTTLSQLGISFGAVGSAIGTTNTLQLDEAKFKAALAADPTAVQSALSALTLSASLEPGGTGSISGLSGTYAGTTPGKYVITGDGSGNLTSVFTPANGTPATTSTAVVLAGGTNASLIPGMTLSIGGVLQAGTHTITVTPSTQSVIHRLKQFAENQAGTGGVLKKRQDSYDAVTSDIAERITVMEERIEKEMEVLRKKFAAMEQAQARAQGILSSLQQMAAQMNANASQKE